MCTLACLAMQVTRCVRVLVRESGHGYAARCMMRLPRFVSRFMTQPHGSHPAVLGASAAPDPHNRPVSALDTSKQPYIMPVVGYSGHIRGLADADLSYGTTHWKNSGAVNPQRKPAGARPWDNRDGAGRPHGGHAPGDFGVYQEDPEFEQKRREADEANEILQLRSMGIRALLAKKPELGGSRGR